MDQSHFEAYISNNRIAVLVFPHDATIIADSLEVLVLDLKALHDETRPLKFWISLAKTKVMVFEVLPDETVQSYS